MKEPGQIAYEAWAKAVDAEMEAWPDLPPHEHDEFAAVEAAVRADERAMVAEYVGAEWKHDEIAAAIRNLGESQP